MARKIVLRGPRYYSPGDEKAFFDWLYAIPCVAGFDGHVRDYHIKLKRPPGEACRRELVALVRRYRMNEKSLAEQLRTLVKTN